MARDDTKRIEEMLEGFVGLRRVRRMLPSNPDVERGIAGLEAALGGAVSQRIAARALGIPHPEVSRLISAKRLKTVDTVKGKNQVDVTSLADMIEANEQEESGESGDGKPDESRDISNILNMRALAFHRAIARGLDRSMVDRAREIVGEWRESGKLTEDQADEWDRILDRPVQDVGAAITDYSETGDELRRSSPFNAMGRRAGDRAD